MEAHNRIRVKQHIRNVSCRCLLALAPFLAAAGFPSLVGAQQPPPITFHLTSYSVPGSLETVVNGIDDSGNITGWYTDQLSSPHGFLLTSGNQLIVVDHPNFLQTVCYGVLGQAVVGAYITKAGLWQAFYYTQGTFTDLPITPGVKGSAAYGINSKGIIVGWYRDANNVDHGFRWNSVRVKRLDVPGMLGTYALAINGSGQITLHSYDSNGVGFGWLKKGTAFLRVGGGVDTWPFGISNSGDIVFSWSDGILWHGGLATKSGTFTFDQPGAFGTWLTGVDSTQNLVGYYQSTDVQNSLIGLRGFYQK